MTILAASLSRHSLVKGATTSCKLAGAIGVDCYRELVARGGSLSELIARVNFDDGTARFPIKTQPYFFEVKILMLNKQTPISKTPRCYHSETYHRQGYLRHLRYAPKVKGWA